VLAQVKGTKFLEVHAVFYSPSYSQLTPNEVSSYMSTRRKAQRQQRLATGQPHSRSTAVPSSGGTALPSGALLKSSQDNALSRALLQLIEPYNDLERGPKALEKILVAGMMAWNLTIIPPETAQTMLKELLDRMPTQDTKAATLQMLGALIERKLQLFPNDRRLLNSYKIKHVQAGIDVEVSYYSPDETSE
jgi:hypothetical protein